MKKHKFNIEAILTAIREMDVGPVNLMEVCGTHTMSIAKSGLKRILPENIRLLSGPGCPVCVTPAEVIDQVLELASRPEVIMTAYGDMIRVPGSVRGDNLARRRAEGAHVEIVYSAMDAVDLAEKNPEKQVVFLGVGFETTAPGTAAAVAEAAERGLTNFSVFSMLKTVEPALRALTADPELQIHGFLCPGHVATIIGEDGFRFLPEDLSAPAVISGFEPEEILYAIYLLIKQIHDKKPALENAYHRAVLAGGNPLARKMMENSFTPGDDIWRGLGVIPGSGLKIRSEYAAYDAEKRFGLTPPTEMKKTACRCGEVIKGKMSPTECPLFGKVCRPEDPEGPCMVSSEGACAAAYKYAEV